MQLQLAEKRSDEATAAITHQLSLVTADQQPEIDELRTHVRYLRGSGCLLAECCPHRPLLVAAQFSHLLLTFFQFGDALLAPNALMLLQPSMLALAPAPSSASNSDPDEA